MLSWLAKYMVRIIAWNIRQGGGSRVNDQLAVLAEANPHIIVLSEFRNNANGTTIRSTLLRRGYLHQVVTGASQEVNSVLIASKFPCDSKLFPNSDKNFPHAIARADFAAFRLYGMYLPHKKKNRLLPFLCEEELDDDVPSIAIGDWNTGKNGIDQEGKSFWYSEYLNRLESRDYFDAFRAIHGPVKEYSWFSHGGNGYRYDHCYMSGCLRAILNDCSYLHAWREDGLSDHSPMVVELAS